VTEIRLQRIVNVLCALVIVATTIAFVLKHLATR
jgi:hypothetical protein